MSGVGAISSMLGNADDRMIAALRVDYFPGSDPGSLVRVMEPGNRATKGEFEASLRTAAEKLVSSAFIKPVLSSLRQSSQAASPFAPGVAERRFGPLLDERIADSIVQGANFNLVDAIVDRYQGAAVAAAGSSSIEVSA